MSKDKLDSGNNLPDGPNTSGERDRLGIGQEPNPGGTITNALDSKDLPAAKGGSE
jgi:hypothetical protein